MSIKLKPRRGEVWLVNFDPTIGSEIQKTRPSIVVSSDAIGILPIKLIAPVTGWNPKFEQSVWHIKLAPNKTNGLTKMSVVDVLQLRGVDIQRFTKKLGVTSASNMEDIVAAIAAVIEYV